MRRPSSVSGALAGAVVLLSCLLGVHVDARAEESPGLIERWRLLPKEDKLLYSNLAVMAGVTAWGALKWDYFQNSPQTDSEGWFGRDTRDGGADKLGHLWVAYAGAHGLSYLYSNWGYGEEEAGRLGALSSWGLTTFMEVGDAFSGKYGFSYEDAVMNTVGAGLGYLLWTNPEVARWIDLRAEWKPNTGNGDPFTDYDNLKYLVALKLGAAKSLRDSPLRFVELHAGYYARNYSSSVREERERNLYVGIGINLSRLFEEGGHAKVGKIFNYFQVPYTYVSVRNDLND